MNNQPMGFYPLETLKQDARRFGVPFRNPCVNRSRVRCIPEDGVRAAGSSVRQGCGRGGCPATWWRSVRRAAPTPARETWCGGRASSPRPCCRWCGPGPSTLSSPTAGRRCGTPASPFSPSRNGQRAFPVSTQDGAPDLADFTAYERMVGEYRVMAVYPRGHLMEFVRPTLSPKVLPTAAVEAADEGEEVLVAGWPVARQHPRGKDGTVFVTIEDEDGRRAAHPLAPGLRPPPQGAGEPGAPGPRRRLPVGRHHQCHRLPRPAHRRPRPHARRPRLALSGVTMLEGGPAAGGLLAPIPPTWGAPRAGP